MTYLYKISAYNQRFCICHITYRKSDELKVVMQPVKIIRTLDPFKPKKGKGKTQKRDWNSDKKRETSVGKNRGCVRVESISYF